jgi:DNA-directed RNA polymerase subunit M/transcription elongation factor TFIIS
MATSRITCPDCKSVLKPGKPIPDGKKVKCPKCSKIFTTPGLVEEEVEERPRKKPAAKKQKAAIKKAAPEPAPKKKPVDDDEEDTSGGIYAPVQEDEKADEDKPDIEYAPDMSIKDLRGPAQAAVVKPSNYLLLIGGISALLDILIICVSFWPMVFSEHLIDHADFLEKKYKKAGGADTAGKIKSIPKERKDIKKEDLAELEDAESEERKWDFVQMGIFILMLVYNGVAIIGAVRMQNMESRGWGIASSIMTIIPFGAAGILTAVSYACYILFAGLLDDADMGKLYGAGVGGLVWLGAVIVGVWSLRILMSQEVRDGFEYVAE